MATRPKKKTCMYLNTLTHLGRKPPELPLPKPLIWRSPTGLLQRLDHQLPDTHLLFLTLAPNLKSLAPITQTTDRVGGTLQGYPIEINVKAIRLVEKRVIIPLCGISQDLPIGFLRNVTLHIDNI